MGAVKRKAIFMLLLFLLLLSVSCAYRSTDVAMHEAERKTFLWKAESETAVVYLLGSIHVAKEDFYPLDDAIETAFEASEKLILEIHMDEKTQMEAAQKFRAAALYTPGDSLDKHISRELREMLDHYLEDKHIPKIFYQLKPWFVSMMVTMGKLQELGFRPEFGIDRYFQNKAEGDKLILSMETVNEQLSLFNSVSDSVQELMLRESLETAEKMDQMMKAVMEAWRRGDTERVEAILTASTRKPEYGPLFQDFLVRRNRKMAKNIEDHLKGKSTCFAIAGALHLVGEKGIVRLLRDKGYLVEQQ